LVSSTHLGSMTRFLLLSETLVGFSMSITFSDERTACRHNCCKASAVQFWSDSLWTHYHVLLSHIRDSPNLAGPQALRPFFISSYDSQDYR
jgi:hypothetical protein